MTASTSAALPLQNNDAQFAGKVCATVAPSLKKPRHEAGVFIVKCQRMLYRLAPEPAPGPIVGAPGGGSNAGLPDGFCKLFAPPDMLPAPVLSPPLVELPVVIPGVVVPFVDDPVLSPLADPPTPGEPVPVCARANELANVSVAANPRVTNFMMGFLSGEKGKTAAAGQCSCP
jgi:hypothetical protein